MKKGIAYTAFALLLILSIVMGWATWDEHLHGTEHAWSVFYRSWWFNLLWTWLVLTGGYYIFKAGLWKKKPAFLLHIALIVVVAGAGITRFSGKTGIVHVREQQAIQSFFCEEAQRNLNLPFSLTLKSFQVEFYPGTESPSNYKSIVEINDLKNGKRFESEISMNHILKYRGYRFYQSSFDNDKKGSILSVNRDTIGITVTYAGYFLLFIAMIWILADRRGRFVELLHKI